VQIFAYEDFRNLTMSMNVPVDIFEVELHFILMHW